MRLVFFAFLVPFLLIRTHALALDTVRCTDAKGEAKLEYDIEFKDENRGAGIVKNVRAKFENFVISTKQTDPGSKPETILDQVSDDSRLEILLESPDLAKITLRLRLFRDFEYDNTDKEYDNHVVAGTLSAMGAGVWGVTCEGW